MLKSKFMSEAGLLYGKMGVCISFFHFSKSSGNEVYEDIALNLLNELCEKVHYNSSIDFGFGLCGVGWGIEYLIKNEFVCGDSIEICAEIDKLIMMRDPRRVDNPSLETGMEGLLHYVCAHLSTGSNFCNGLPFDDTYLDDLMSTLKKWNVVNQSLHLENLIKKFSAFYLRKTPIDYQFFLSSLIDRVAIDSNSLNSLPLGLKSGLAGILLRHIHLV